MLRPLSFQPLHQNANGMALAEKKKRAQTSSNKVGGEGFGGRERESFKLLTFFTHTRGCQTTPLLNLLSFSKDLCGLCVCVRERDRRKTHYQSWRPPTMQHPLQRKTGRTRYRKSSCERTDRPIAITSISCFTARTFHSFRKVSSKS